MEISDCSDEIIGIKCTLRLVNDLKPDDLPRVWKFLKCYRDLTMARSPADIQKVKSEFDADICRSVWGILGDGDRSKILEMKKNGN